MLEVEKNRYSDEDLDFFKTFIERKLKIAKEDWNFYNDAISNTSGNGTDDTSPSWKILEEGSSTSDKELAGYMRDRQTKSIQSLEDALFRVENKTYGICLKTRKLIPRIRLIAAPEALYFI